MTQRQVPIIEVLTVLELPSDAWPLHTGLNSDEAKIKLAEFQTMLKKHRRDLAKKYHPDKIGDDTKMKKINDIFDKVMDLKIIVHKPRPQRVTFHFSNNPVNDDATTSTNFFSGIYTIFR